MAPSSFIERDDIEKSKTLLEQRGYSVFVHPQTWERDGQSAGTVLQKALALQGLWQRDDIHMIWSAGGGNHALDLLGSIAFSKLRDKPKAFIGFSDVTALLNAVYAETGLVTYHGPVFKNLHKYKNIEHLLDTLSGSAPAFPLESVSVLKHGEANGHLVGGNLSLFQYLPKTLPGNFWQDSILFLEDCNEELSKIDRMFVHLKRLGVLDQIKGLILGEFINLTDTGRAFGLTFQDIVERHTSHLDIPILMNAPFGHGENLYTLPVGAPATLSTSPCSLKIHL